MSAPLHLNRRRFLTGSTALSVAGLCAGPGRAAAPLLGPTQPSFTRVRLGQFDVTTLLVGERVVDGPKNLFASDADADAFTEISADAHLPTDRFQFPFIAPVVNTGTQLILFDTGLDAALTVAALEAAGYTADQVDMVVITHMHGDHIGGLVSNDEPTFPNATYVAGRVEYDAWAEQSDARFDGIVRPMAEQFSFIEDGAAVASGVTAMASFGHTPGHMSYMLESDGQQMLLAGDFATHHVWSLAHPEWPFRFDIKPTLAVETRKKMLDMLATERIPFSAYHMPFPAFGYVDRDGDGYRYIPHTYQLVME